MHLGERVAVLPDDGELRVVAGRRFGQSQWQIGEIADIGQHPDLGLAGLELQLRLELAVDGELHIPLVLRQRGIGGDILRRAAEALQVARDELILPRWLAGDSGPAYQLVMNCEPTVVSEKLTGAKLGE